LFRARYQGNQSVVLVFLAQLTDDVGQHELLIELAGSTAAVKNPHVSRTYRAVLHTQKLTHGAVCPQNIWIEPSGTARLLQFPLVPVGERLKRREPPLVDYLAPELAAGRAPSTRLTDVYGLGCTLFELIAGRVPFPGGTPPQKLARQQAEFPQRLDQLNPRVPADLADLVAEMLAKDPLLRCQDANHVAHLLAPFATGSAPRAGQPPRLGGGGLAPGYGAWKAPDWQAPPKAGSAADPPQPTVAEVSLQGAVEPAAAEFAPPAEEAPRMALAQTIAIDLPEAALAPADKPAGFPVVVTQPSGGAPVRARKRSSTSLWVGIGSALALVAALIVAAVLMQGGSRSPEAQPADSAAAVSAVGAAVTANESNAAQPPPEAPGPDDETETGDPAAGALEDDGQMLWASPTAGPPLDPAYLPHGAQVIAALRPAELMKSDEGARLLAALAAAGLWSEQRVRAMLGVEPADVEQLTVAFAADANLAPQAVYVARLARDVPPQTLVEAWGKPAPKKHQGKEFFQAGEQAWYLPPPDAGRLVVAGPLPLVKPMLESDGQPLLAKGIERVWKHTDSSRQMSLVFAPSYLLTDGQGLLAGHLAKLRLPLREFLDESIETVLLSAHLGEQFYVEFRGVAPIDRPPLELVDLLRNRWEQVPERIESLVAALNPDPHGRLVVNRFPRMMQLARDYTRGGVEDGQIVLNAYLPAAAAHNLAVGADLTLLESAGTARPRPAESAAGPRSLDELLARPISLSFPRESLDRAMDLLAKELGVEIVILGADLQLEGITKNQSLNNVDQRDQPADAVLRKLLALANPDDKLVYVVKASEGGREAIFITTRAAAKKRGEQLPAGF
jgi:hypothetical protein